MRSIPQPAPTETIRVEAKDEAAHILSDVSCLVICLITRPWNWKHETEPSETLGNLFILSKAFYGTTRSFQRTQPSTPRRLNIILVDFVFYPTHGMYSLATRLEP
ncbi:hypothetical protein ABW19_dt0202521 [Dactylella cylindrospora]|nr:hypothetical protein ABW19_dt0202521 [Dactylella cylindrospora]